MDKEVVVVGGLALASVAVAGGILWYKKSRVRASPASARSPSAGAAAGGQRDGQPLVAAGEGSLAFNATPSSAAAGSTVGEGSPTKEAFAGHPLEWDSEDEDDTAADLEGVLSRKEFRPFRLCSVTTVSQNVKLFRFALPSSHQVLELPPGKHVQVRAFVNGKKVLRYYNPISNAAVQKGTFDLLVKDYPEEGTMSGFIHSLRRGDSLFIRGPFGKFKYRPNKWAKIGMVAGGTGITPMLQIIRSVLNNPDDLTHITLLYFNHTERDILMREELELLAATNHPAFTVRFIITGYRSLGTARGGSGSGGASDTSVSDLSVGEEDIEETTKRKERSRRRRKDQQQYKSTRTERQGAVFEGRPSSKLLQRNLPPPSADHTTKILMCGPPEFNAAVRKRLLSHHLYPPRALYTFPNDDSS
ncbi:NADH-cytochrome b5 reductase 2 [Balamuthia mandrillaris]